MESARAEHQPNLDPQSPGDHAPNSPLQSQAELLDPSSNPSPPHTKPNWFKRFLIISPVKRLENKASVARDHLANERTFLAWFRTSLSLTSIGIALAQLARIPKQMKVQPVTNLMRSIRPILDGLNSSLPDPRECLDQNQCPPSAQESSLRSLLDHINQNLINVDSSLDRFDSLHSITRTQDLASLIAKFYVCLGLLFLFIGTQRYFHVQKVLQTGLFPQSRMSIGLTSVVVSALLIATFIQMIKISF